MTLLKLRCRDCRRDFVWKEKVDICPRCTGIRAGLSDEELDHPFSPFRNLPFSPEVKGGNDQ